MNRIVSIIAFIILAMTSGCQRQSTDVLATTSLIADAAQRIGGGRVKVECLMGPGVDPHKFQPSAGDLDKLASAKLILYNGLHLEGKMTDVLERSAGSRAVAVTRNIDPARLLNADVDGGAHDPHVWFDVALWIECVRAIRDEMIERFPEHEAEFRANAGSYLSELTALDGEVRSKAARLPKERRILITSHDAFGYFARAYGFEVWGLQGVSTASESGTKDVEELAKRIGDKRVPAVFTETSVPPQGLKQVLDSVRKDHTVQLVADADALFSDALGEPGTPGGTYIGMVRHNIDVIVRSLGK